MKGLTPIDLCFRISIAILLSIGLQYFIVGITCLYTIDFSTFGITNWVLEVCYLVFSVSTSLKVKK